MDDRDIYISLFDIYEQLLTNKQQEYFKGYYFDDLSIGEIAINYNVSRNAVFDQIKKVCSILLEYENKLQINKNNELLKTTLNMDDASKIKEVIKIILEEC